MSEAEPLKISLNKLGEYMEASPYRREKIVSDQKKPDVFKIARYKKAREAIVRYAESYFIDEAGAEFMADVLRAEEGGGEFAKQDRELSAEAIERFIELSDAINIDGYEVKGLPVNYQSSVEMGGIVVSVRPEVLILDPASQEPVGAIKVHFSKSVPLTKNAAQYIAIGLQSYLKALNSDPTKVLARLCYVVDLGAELVTTAPNAYIKRMRDLEAAGREIKLRWDNY